MDGGYAGTSKYSTSLISTSNTCTAQNGNGGNGIYGMYHVILLI